MIDLDTVKIFFEILEKLKAGYFVSGGFALEGFRGKLTRDHKDIDIYLFEEYLKRLIIDLKKHRFRCFKKLNKYEVSKDGLVVDLLPLKDEGKFRTLYGNHGNTFFPKEIFSKFQEGKIGSIKFRIVSNEVFALEMPYSKYKEDKEFAESLPYNKILFSKIKNVLKKKPDKIELEEI